MAHTLVPSFQERSANPRNAAIQLAENRRQPVRRPDNMTGASERFGIRVFNRAVMQKMLPKEIYQNVVEAMEGRSKIRPEFANPIAVAMKDWAVSLGATHYCHWFQPLTGASAEKHDAFIDWSNKPGEMIEKFSGNQLIQGEPDASSFPSGGLRSTYEARGYTGWDPTSPVFVWKAGDGITLCIPCIFFSWTGDVLDTKIPLLRSDRLVGKAAKRMLQMTGIEANFVQSTLGLEQEYFVIDRSLRNLRPDLVMIGRTVFGAPSPKGQELQDHYFGAVKDRILSFMQDFEDAALELGIPLKTRHNEVAPAQHEVAPIFEKSSSAIDHNILLMELMRQIAVRHNLACLLHEKPFADINGSGKHANWSLSTDTGINLLNPTDTPENNLHFLILLAAILSGVHRHSALLRASIGSASNDCRLGGHEAPPAIISVYLGQELENVIDEIVEKGAYTRTGGKVSYNLGILELPDLAKDNTDRNRTSPLAFTGNKFEFRAVGSSANPAFAITVLNAAVAESLNEMLDEIATELKGKTKASYEEVALAAFPVLRRYFKASKPVRFSGDNYSEAWVKEAKKRGLPNHTKSVYAFEALKTKETARVFQGILTEQELKSRYDILVDMYSCTIGIEANLMLDIFHSQILPAALKYQAVVGSNNLIAAQALGKSAKLKGQNQLLKKLNEGIEQAITAADHLEAARNKASVQPLEKRGRAFSDQVVPAGEELRTQVDALERLVDDSLWPIPKYREILFLI